MLPSRLLAAAAVVALAGHLSGTVDARSTRRLGGPRRSVANGSKARLFSTGKQLRRLRTLKKDDDEDCTGKDCDKDDKGSKPGAKEEEEEEKGKKGEEAAGPFGLRPGPNGVDEEEEDDKKPAGAGKEANEVEDDKPGKKDEEESKKPGAKEEEEEEKGKKNEDDKPDASGKDLASIEGSTEKPTKAPKTKKPTAPPTAPPTKTPTMPPTPEPTPMPVASIVVAPTTTVAATTVAATTAAAAEETIEAEDLGFGIEGSMSLSLSMPTEEPADETETPSNDVQWRLPTTTAAATTEAAAAVEEDIEAEDLGFGIEESLSLSLSMPAEEPTPVTTVAATTEAPKTACGPIFCAAGTTCVLIPAPGGRDPRYACL